MTSGGAAARDGRGADGSGESSGKGQNGRPEPSGYSLSLAFGESRDTDALRYDAGVAIRGNVYPTG